MNRPWLLLTEEQRCDVLATIDAAIEAARDEGDMPEAVEAHQAAHRELAVMIREEWVTAEAIADACVECGIGEVGDEDVPSFIRRLHRAGQAKTDV